MATAAISEGAFQHVEPRAPSSHPDLDVVGIDESNPSSPTSPMGDSARPTSPGVLSDEEDIDGLDDGRKKKRFRPFRSIRKLFKRKRPSKLDDEFDGGVRSKSTGELNLSDIEERMFDPKQTSTTTMTSSRSESSVFVPDQPSLRTSETSKSSEHISKDFAKDLSAMLARRTSPNKETVHKSEDDVTMVTPDETTSEKEAPRKEKSFDDNDINGKNRREPQAARRAKSMSAMAASPWAMEKRNKYAKIADEPAYLDLDAVKTASSGHLSHSAAKHKMSIKPKSRRATTKARLSQKKKEEQPDNGTLNDISTSSKLGGTSLQSDMDIDESNTSSLLESQEQPSVSLPVNDKTFSTREMNIEMTKSKSIEKEESNEEKQQPKWSPSTSPKLIINSQMNANNRKEITTETEARKPMQKMDTNQESFQTSNDKNRITEFNNQNDKIETTKTDQNKAPRTVIIIPKKTDLPSNNILVPSELVIRDKPVNKPDKKVKKIDVKVTETKMSDDEDEEQPRKSVRDRILLFQNTASRNNSNNSSPAEVRKVQIEVADKNGNTTCDNGNTSYNIKLHSNQGVSSETSSKEQEKNQQNKRPGNKRSFMPKTDICIVCNKAVYMNEMSRSEGKVFHKACQKCVECTRTLQIGNVLLVGSKLYCRLHGSQEKMKLLKMRSEVE